MFDDLATYFYENVVTPFKEYLDEKKSCKVGRSRDLKLALMTASALYHLREHLPPANRLSWTKVTAECADYALLGDVVNASKHRVLTKGTPLITNATQIFEQTVVTEYQDEIGQYRYIDKIVVIELSDGSQRNLLDVMANVMNFWQYYLHSIGIIAETRNYSFPPHEPKSRAECEENRLDLEIVQGLPFKDILCLKRFNYEKNVVEPIDLTGCKVSGSIYELPKQEFVLNITNNITGEEISKTVSLSMEESNIIASLATEDEKQDYLYSLPSVIEAFNKLAIEAGIIQEGRRVLPDLKGDRLLF